MQPTSALGTLPDTPEEHFTPISKAIQWVSVQGLGETDMDNVYPADIITAVKFDKSGEFIGVGDEGGRLIIFNKCEIKGSRYFDYKFLIEVQSKNKGFDALSNRYVSERINQIAFLN